MKERRPYVRPNVVEYSREGREMPCCAKSDGEDAERSANVGMKIMSRMWNMSKWGMEEDKPLFDLRDRAMTLGVSYG